MMLGSSNTREKIYSGYQFRNGEDRNPNPVSGLQGNPREMDWYSEMRSKQVSVFWADSLFVPYWHSWFSAIGMRLLPSVFSFPDANSIFSILFSPFFWLHLVRHRHYSSWLLLPQNMCEASFPSVLCFLLPLQITNSLILSHVRIQNVGMSVTQTMCCFFL